MKIPNLEAAIPLANIIVMALLIAFIVMQNRSGGLSSVFGGSGGVVSARRGVEKWMFVGTIILSILFVGLSITSVILKAN